MNKALAVAAYEIADAMLDARHAHVTAGPWPAAAPGTPVKGNKAAPMEFGA